MTQFVDVDAGCLRSPAFFGGVAHMSPSLRFFQTLFCIYPGLFQQGTQAIELSDEIGLQIVAMSLVVTHFADGAVLTFPSHNSWQGGIRRAQGYLLS
jgi:hypothetical protein